MDFGDSRQFPGKNLVRAEAMDQVFGPLNGSGGGFRQIPLANDDPLVPLFNLSVLRQKMDSLQQFLSESVDRNTLLGKDRMDMVSTEITSAIHQIIVNGAALLACSQSHNFGSQIGEGTVLMAGKGVDQEHLKAPSRSLVNGNETVTDLIGSSARTICQIDSKAPVSYLITAKSVEPVDLTVQTTCPITRKSTKPADLRCRKLIQSDSNTSTSYLNHEKLKDEIDIGNCEIGELDAVELLAEHIHFCEICGKGFKRDANLRMHMRAHGNQFKTPEALAKPDKCAESSRITRFSCPFIGCNRNKSHKKFRPLKSVICVKNHFKRSHCPKMFSCNRCNKKSFSVLADLKSHLKHCGESKWRCSCGTTFSRKDKLFGHMALFEGHMPAFSEVDDKSMGAVLIEEEEEKEETQMRGDSGTNGFDQGFFDRLLEGFDAMEDDCLKDVFGSSGFGIETKELYEI